MRVCKPAFPAARITQGVVPISKGGTNATTAIGAAASLGGVHALNLDEALSVAKLMATGKINPLHLPDSCIIGSTLNGPVDLYPTQIGVYTITNYDSNSAYVLSVSVGEVRRVDDAVTIVAPNYATTLTLTINNRTYPIVVKEPWPLKPTVAASTTGTNTSATGVFTGSAFAMVTGVVKHRRTDWQVAYDVDFTNIYINSENDHSHLTGWEAQNLAFNTTYYVRIRYEGNNGILSEWSDPVEFTTLANYTPNTEEAKFVASDKATNDNFGYAVAVDHTATRVAVGAYQDDDTLASNLGSVYIFKRTGTTWAQEAKLVQYTLLSNNIYTGFSVAMDSTATRVIAGAYGTRSQKGSVYIWVRSGTTWTLEYELYPSDGVNNDRLGWSVDCNEDCTWIVAGEPQRDLSGASNCGAVHLFQKVNGTWYDRGRLVASDYSSNDYFGWSVAIDGTGTRVIAGSYLDDPGGTNAAGSAYIFARSGSTWAQEIKLIASDKEPSAQFGFSVSLNSDGSRAVVGANLATVQSLINAGAAYIFDRTGTTWAQVFRLTAYDRTATDNFGCSVSINAVGDKVLVGAMLADPGGTTTAGAAYVFARVDAQWVTEAKLTASDKAASDNFGVSVAISGEGGRAVVGANTEDPGNTNNAGSAYLYS